MRSPRKPEVSPKYHISLYLSLSLLRIYACGSIIIGRSAKPKSVYESSLYGVFPPRRHFSLVYGAQRDCILTVRQGRTRLRADVNYYWQFHETNSLLALSSVHTRRDTTDSMRRLIAFGLVGFDKRTMRP